MKPFKILLKKTWLLFLALIFLSSCYDIVFVSQDKDIQTNQVIQPKVCIHVSSFYNYNTPYFGVLIPDDWSIQSGFDYVQEFDGYAMKIGQVNFSKALSHSMENIDPAPAGYYWWVGFGTEKITTNGVFSTSPLIQTGDTPGKYELEYMLGDTYNGLNFLRSSNNPLYMIDKWTPAHLTSSLNEQKIELEWERPAVIHGVKGYNVYRNGVQLNEKPFLQKYFTDDKPATNSYIYEVSAEYYSGTESELSAPAMICYCPSGPSINLDNSNDMAMVFDNPVLNPTMSLTLEAWIKFKHGGSGQPTIISKGNGENSYELYTSNASSHRYLVFNSTPGYLVSNTQLHADIWYHVAATYDGKMIRLFINGKLDAEKPGFGCINISDGPLLIGKRSTTSHDIYMGNIDEVRIWETPRTAEQIEKYQRLPLPDDKEGLVGYWQMDEGCNYYCGDQSGEDNNVYMMGTCWSTATFPFVPDLKSTETKFTIPVVNHYFPQEPLHTIVLIYKFNPQILAFEELDLFETQIKKWNVQTTCSTLGYLKIEATSNGTVHTSTDLLVKLKFKALHPATKSVVDFVKAEFNGVKIRTKSGYVSVSYTPDQSIAVIGMLNDNTNDLNVRMYPNPVVSNASFMYDLAEDALVDLSIFNLAGQKVFTVISEHQYTGAQQAEFDANSLNPGVYMYVLKANNSKYTGKIIVQK
jgi:hypothetical protein